MLTFQNQSLIGTIIRTTKHIPPCVWVVNQHTDEITVVVSKYRPNRMLTGVGLNASPTGGGLDISATVCTEISVLNWHNSCILANLSI